MRDLNTFFKKYTLKVGILQRRKTRFLIFLDIKLSAKSNKIELSEEIMAMWREEQTLMSCYHCIQAKMKKTKL